MAYPINQNDIVQLTIRYAQSNIVEMMNVLHYRYVSTPTITDGRAAILALLQFFEAAVPGGGWTDRWQPLASNLVALDRFWGQKIYPIRYAKVEWDITTTGAVAGNPLPGICQWGIVKRSEVAARYGRGGIRVPGLPDTMEEGSRLTEAALPDAESLALLVAAQLEPVTGQIWRPIILRRDTPGVSEFVSEVSVNRTISTQRTRIAFRGI